MEASHRASVYARSEGFYVVSDDRTVAGFYVAGSAVRIDADADDQALGSAIVSALDAVRDRVPTPPRDASVADALVSLSPARSWRTFARAAELVCVADGRDQITFESWRHTARRVDAFEPVPSGQSERVGRSDPVAIGAMARHLLGLTTNT